MTISRGPHSMLICRGKKGRQDWRLCPAALFLDFLCRERFSMTMIMAS